MDEELRKKIEDNNTKVIKRLLVEGYESGLIKKMQEKLDWVEIRMKCAEKAQEENESTQFNEGREDVYFEWSEWLKELLKIKQP